MKTQKLTSKDKKEIAARVAAGEKQGDLVKEYDVSPALISRVVKQSKVGAKKSKPDVPVSRSPVDLSDRTEEQLCNRYREIHREMIRHNGEVQQRLAEVDGLQLSIEAESQKDESVRDDVWILAQRRRLTWCLDTATTGVCVVRALSGICCDLRCFCEARCDTPLQRFYFQGIGTGIKNGVSIGISDQRVSSQVLLFPSQ